MSLQPATGTGRLISRALPRVFGWVVRHAAPRKLDFAAAPGPGTTIFLAIYWNGNRRYPLLHMQLTDTATAHLIWALITARGETTDA